MLNVVFKRTPCPGGTLPIYMKGRMNVAYQIDTDGSELLVNNFKAKLVWLKSPSTGNSRSLQWMSADVSRTVPSPALSRLISLDSKREDDHRNVHLLVFTLLNRPVITYRETFCTTTGHLKQPHKDILHRAIPDLIPDAWFELLILPINMRKRSQLGEIEPLLHSWKNISRIRTEITLWKNGTGWQAKGKV